MPWGISAVATTAKSDVWCAEMRPLRSETMATWKKVAALELCLVVGGCSGGAATDSHGAGGSTEGSGARGVGATYSGGAPAAGTGTGGGASGSAGWSSGGTFPSAGQGGVAGAPGTGHAGAGGTQAGASGASGEGGGVGGAGATTSGGTAGSGGVAACSPLTECDGQCVDLSTNDTFCGNCDTSCAAHERCVSGACSSPGRLVLSEVHVRGEGAQFIEVYNGSAAPVDLTGYRVRWDWPLPFPREAEVGDLELQPGEYHAFFTRNFTWAEGANLTLLDGNNAAVDFVQAGALPDVPGGVQWSGGHAPNPSWAVRQSLVRDVALPDSDTAAEWSLADEPSRGRACPREQCGKACVDLQVDAGHCGTCGQACAAGDVCLNGTCSPASDTLWLSEYRRGGRPGVEVHNPSTSEIDLQGHTLVVESANAVFQHTFADESLAPGAFRFVYMGDGTDDDHNRFGEASAAFDGDVAITLLDPSATALDFLRTGSSLADAPATTMWIGDNAPATTHGSDESLKRDVTVADTDSAQEWHLSHPATPGHWCPPATSWCDGRCVGLNEDKSNCGSCGNSCAAAESCIDGACSGAGALVIASVTGGGFYLYNGTEHPILLGGYTLEWVGSEVGSFAFPLLSFIDAASYLGVAEGDCAPQVGSICMGEFVGAGYWDGVQVVLRDDSLNLVDSVTAGEPQGPAAFDDPWAGPPVDLVAPRAKLVRNVFLPDTDTAQEWTSHDNPPHLVVAGCRNTGCGGICVDTQASAQHCGACGNHCFDDQVCSDGRCTDATGVRLDRVDGDDNGTSRGRVSLWDDGSWTSVASHTSTDFVGRVCRYLGFSGEGLIVDTDGPPCSNCALRRSDGCANTPATAQACLQFVTQPQAGYRLECEVP